MADEGPDRPRWAEGLDAGGTRRVRNLVAQELRARHITEFRFVEDGVEWRDVDGWTSLAPLADLAFRCAAADRAAWSDLVADGVAELLEVDAGDQPTLREGEVTAAMLRELRPRPEPLISDAPAPARARDPALEESAPPGGIRSPFARPPAPTPESPADAPSAIDLRATLDAPVAAAAPAPVEAEDWEEEEEDDDGHEALATPAPPASRRRKLGFYALLAAFALTGALELRAFFVEPEAPDFWVTPANDVLVEATPAGEVLVIAEADGRTLGFAPLRILVPAGPEVAVFLAAPGRTPQRVVLPTSGAVKTHLEPALPADPSCVAEVAIAGTWQYQTVPGDETSKDGRLQIRGSALVRVVPEGYGAWIVKCPSQGGTIQVGLERRFPPVVDIRAQAPRGALLHVDERPLGSIPIRWTQARAFSMLRVRTVTGEYTARWVAIPGSLGVDMPIDDSRAAPLTVPGTQLESPVPYIMRPQPTPSSELDAPLFDVED